MIRRLALLGRMTVAGVLTHFSGTAPTTAPADRVQFWVADRNGGGTASPKILTEDNGVGEGVLGYVIQAFDATERTCTNSATDLSTLVVNIPVGDAFMVTGRMRKSAGAATAALLGMKLNGSQVMSNGTASSATNQAEDGLFRIGPMRAGITNYPWSVHRIELLSRVSSTGAEAVSNSNFTITAAPPTATITEIIITGNSQSASVTMGIKDVTVYRIACS